MVADSEGFLYPHINTNECTNCSICEKVCSMLHLHTERIPQEVLAATNKDGETRLASSSGGIFSMLAEKIINEDGVVFGAKFDEQWQVVIDYAETMEGVRTFMGSKYVQARTALAYKEAERFLKDGRKVLFSGSPCQISGLHHYLCKSYANLTTVDFICHGVPSPKVWRRYLDEVVPTGQRINDIQFRDKHKGWKKFSFVLSCDGQRKSVSMSSCHFDNPYMRAFLSDLILRPSCYNCKVKCGRSQSDITLADYWGIQQVHPELDDDKGTSTILINTPKGKELLDYAKMKYVNSTYETITQYNPAWIKSAILHPKRSDFFAQIDDAKSVVDLIIKVLRPSPYHRLRKQVRRYIHLTKSIFVTQGRVK